MARNPADLYEVGPAAPVPDGDLVMLYYLDGFIDAGAAGRLLTTHLMTTLEHEQVASFDIDSLLDYRSRRPIMLSGQRATICIRTSAVAGAFPALAVPMVRRIPRSTTLTASWLVGGSWPASLWW